MRTCRFIMIPVALLLLSVAASRELVAQPEPDVDYTILATLDGPNPEPVLDKLLANAPEDMANLRGVGTLDADDTAALRRAARVFTDRYEDPVNLFIQVEPDPNDSARHGYAYIFLQQGEDGELSITLVNGAGQCECVFGARTPADPMEIRMRNTFIIDGRPDGAKLESCLAALGNALKAPVDDDLLGHD